MQLKFDANQEFQVSAVESVVKLFEGQPTGSLLPSLTTGTRQLGLSGIGAKQQIEFSETIAFSAIDNRLALDVSALLKNLHEIQFANGIPLDPTLQFIEAEADLISGKENIQFPNFSVEMETGTGKTYVYLRTALALFRRYGWRKFIIVVPSVAVREGVTKTFQITERHFRELFANTPYKFAAYDSENLSQVRQFATSSNVEFLVMTIDSFNKASNVIRQTTDRLQGETPIHLIQATRPILILDEPQNMESELRIKALAALNPLFALRYSATHRNPYNVVYRLTPWEAYRQGLVKRIEVAGITKENDANQVFMRLVGVKSEKRTFTARIAVHKLLAKGQVKETIITVRPGESLEAKSNRPEYGAFTVEEINIGEQCVRFTNGTEIKTGEARGADREAIFREQIRYTVEEHFRKQARLKAQGIKVISLVFIDRVENYQQADGKTGIIRQIFNEAFNEIKSDFPDFAGIDPEKAQAAYFAKRRTKEGAEILEDSKTGESEKDKEAYELIMRNKEQLLSFDEPTCFVFSHSALREGWDSPNVFQICTLNQSVSEIRKRQEIGRGVRLAVDQSGDRVRDEKVNVLTVVANESYERYVSQYQGELEDAYGTGADKVPIRNARKRGAAKLKKHFVLKPEFKELWEKIKHKTRYSVEIDSEALLGEVIPKLDAAKITPPQLSVSKARVQADEEKDQFAGMLVAKRELGAIKPGTLPNLVELMGNLMEHTSPPVRLTRRTLLEIFRRTKNQKSAVENPHEFATVAVRLLKEALPDQLVNGVKYERINAWYEMAQLETEIPGWQDHLIPAPKRGVYDQISWQSEIERKFVADLENDERVKLFIKLPGWFLVPTPVGDYNPDWAIVMEKRDKHGKATGEPLLYLVRETKDTGRSESLRPNEARKLTCGKRHFKDALGVDYKVIKSAGELE
jgi:type III restriction enzyme